MPDTPTGKAAATSDTVWAVYDELVATGELPDRGGRHDQAVTDQAVADGRIPAGHSVRIFPDPSGGDAVAGLSDDVFTAVLRARRNR